MTEVFTLLNILSKVNLWCPANVSQMIHLTRRWLPSERKKVRVSPTAYSALQLSQEEEGGRRDIFFLWLKPILCQCSVSHSQTLGMLRAWTTSWLGSLWWQTRRLTRTGCSHVTWKWNVETSLNIPWWRKLVSVCVCVYVCVAYGRESIDPQSTIFSSMCPSDHGSLWLRGRDPVPVFSIANPRWGHLVTPEVT